MTERMNKLLGKVITEITGAEVGSEHIRFVCAAGTYEMFHSQNCCETVEVEDISGNISDLIGSPILVAEARESEECPEGSAPHGDSNTWTFYTFRTLKGTVDIRWHGSSNGYYSESVYDSWEDAPLSASPSPAPAEGDVEAVARAIWHCLPPEGDYSGSVSDPEKLKSDHAYEIATAAISAMRPTETPQTDFKAMFEAVDKRLQECAAQLTEWRLYGLNQAIGKRVALSPEDRARVEEVRELHAKIGGPLSEEWMYSAIRHCQRNMDFDYEDDGNEPDRYAGGPMAKIINALPELLSLIDKLTEAG